MVKLVIPQHKNTFIHISFQIKIIYLQLVVDYRSHKEVAETYFIQNYYLIQNCL